MLPIPNFNRFFGLVVAKKRLIDNIAKINIITIIKISPRIKYYSNQNTNIIYHLTFRELTKYGSLLHSKAKLTAAVA